MCATYACVQVQVTPLCTTDSPLFDCCSQVVFTFDISAGSRGDSHCNKAFSHALYRFGTVRYDGPACHKATRTAVAVWSMQPVVCFAVLRPAPERCAVLCCSGMCTALYCTAPEHAALTLPLVASAGGKWTTYRRMAEDAVDTALARGEIPVTRQCVTSRLKLLGGQSYSSTLHTQVGRGGRGWPQRRGHCWQLLRERLRCTEKNCVVGVPGAACGGCRALVQPIAGPQLACGFCGSCWPADPVHRT